MHARREGSPEPGNDRDDNNVLLFDRFFLLSETIRLKKLMANLTNYQNSVFWNEVFGNILNTMQEIVLDKNSPGLARGSLVELFVLIQEKKNGLSIFGNGDLAKTLRKAILSLEKNVHHYLQLRHYVFSEEYNRVISTVNSSINAKIQDAQKRKFILALHMVKFGMWLIPQKIFSCLDCCGAGCEGKKGIWKGSYDECGVNKNGSIEEPCCAPVAQLSFLARSYRVQSNIIASQAPKRQVMI